VVLIGFLADAISGLRRLIEDLLYRVRVMEIDDPGRAASPADERYDRPVAHQADR
jgi:hypothetical protein